jgi:hypothetical protein
MADYEVIAEGTLTSTAANIDITSIPATFSHLELVINARVNNPSAATENGNMTVNGLTGSIYGTIGQYNSNGSIAAYNHTPNTRTYAWNMFTVLNDGMPANTYAMTKMIFPNYTNTSVTRKGPLIQSSTGSSNASVYWQFVGMGTITTSAVINQITLISPYTTSYPFMAGTSYYLAGWK